MKNVRAFSAEWSTRPSSRGRHRDSEHESAVIVAASVVEAALIADRYQRIHLKGYELEEIRFDDGLVLMTGVD